MVLAYYGGLRCADVVKFEAENYKFNESTGVRVTYEVSNQGEGSLRNYF